MENQPKMTWYACGQVWPSGTFGDTLDKLALEQVRKIIPNLVPTTYEASEAYLRDEHGKPQGEQDLLREMCVMVPVSLPEDRKTLFLLQSRKLIVPLTDGSMMVFPTADLPPDTFGNPDSVGFLNSNKLMYDPPTEALQKGMIILTYLTKSGPDAQPDSLSS